MSGVEFLDPPASDEPPADAATADHEPAPPVGGVPTPSTRTSTGTLLLAAGCWALGAAACVVGSFQALFVIITGPPTRTGSLDGWGRGEAAFTTVPDVYGPRLGIALCVAGGLLGVAAVLTAAAATRQGRRRRTRSGTTGRLVGFGATAALAGLLGATALYVQAELHAYERLIALQSADTADTIQGFHASFTFGWFVWWGVVAVGLSVLALGADVLAVRVLPWLALHAVGRPVGGDQENVVILRSSDSQAEILPNRDSAQQ